MFSINIITMWLCCILVFLLKPESSRAIEIQGQSSSNNLTKSSESPALSTFNTHSSDENINDDPPMSTLLSTIMYFENFDNGTLVIPGKLVNQTDLSRLHDDDSDDWIPVIRETSNNVTNNNRDDDIDNSNEAETAPENINNHDDDDDVPMISSTLEQWEETNKMSSLENRPDFHVIDLSEFDSDERESAEERYRVSSFVNRPNFHMIDVSDFDAQDETNNVHMIDVSEFDSKTQKRSKALPLEPRPRDIKTEEEDKEPEPRFDIESAELDFPNFETQFFGSFGELSGQKFSRPKPQVHHHHHPSHNSDHRYSHHQQPPATHHHDQHLHGTHKYHPKRETFHSSSHKPKDVSDLYVDDPWKHINKVMQRLSSKLFQCCSTKIFQVSW